MSMDKYPCIFSRQMETIVYVCSTGVLIFELGRNLLKRKLKTKYLSISEIFLFSVPYLSVLAKVVKYGVATQKSLESFKNRKLLRRIHLPGR